MWPRSTAENPPSEEFSKVYFAPVGVGNLSRQGWWESQSAVTQRQLEADARKLAKNFRQAMANAAHSQSGRKLAVVKQPGPDTLIIEAAITDLVPAKAYWNAGATAAGFVVPGAGLLSAAGSGKITVDGRVRDGNNGKLRRQFPRHHERQNGLCEHRLLHMVRRLRGEP